MSLNWRGSWLECGVDRKGVQKELVAKGLKRSVRNLEVDDGQYLLVLPESPDRLLQVNPNMYHLLFNDTLGFAVPCQVNEKTVTEICDSFAFRINNRSSSIVSLPLPPAESVDVSSMASLMKGMIGLFGALFFKGRTGDDEPVCDRAVS